MRSLRIYPIILVGILLLAIFLPNLYKDIFAKRINTSKVYYSPVDKDFIKMTTVKGKERKVIYSNLDGSEEFTQDEYKAKLPFIFYNDLVKIDKFPKEFMAYAQNPRVIRLEKSYLKVKPSMITSKVVNLTPLFESKPKYSSLKLPDDLFRLDENGISFIKSDSNTVDEKKSKLYSNKLLELGAVFPLKDAYGTPTTRKPFDEGYFITDSKSQLFHVKQVENQAVINKVETNGINIKFVLNKEDARKEYYGLIVDDKSNIYLLMYDDYELLKLPIKDFDYKTQNFRMFTNPISRIITIEYKDYETQEQVIKSYVTNLDYEIQKENVHKYSLKQSDIYETVKATIFPYKIYLVNGEEGYISYDIRDISMKSFVIYFILALLYLLFVKISKRELSSHIIPAILIALTGIYAIVVLILFNKFLTQTRLNHEKEKNETNK